MNVGRAEGKPTVSALANLRSALRKSGGGGHEGGGMMRWLLTYADLITLLLMFFVVLVSMSNQDLRRFAMLKEALNRVFTIPTEAMRVDLSLLLRNSGEGEGLLSELKTEPRQGEEDTRLIALIDDLALRAGLPQQIVTGYHEDGIVISVLGSLLFPSGRAELRPEADGALREIGALIARLPYEVRIEGHTDDLPPAGSAFRSNLELSLARSYAVSDLLMRRGVASSRVVASGYGEIRPIAANGTAEERSRNRRVDIVLLTKQASDRGVRPPGTTRP